MKRSLWEDFKRMALSGSPDENRKIPVALIVDSPWLPGFMGISTLDYFLLPDEWIKANLYIEERFPEVLFLPGPLAGVWNGNRAFRLRMQDKVVEKQSALRASCHQRYFRRLQIGGS